MFWVKHDELQYFGGFSGRVLELRGHGLNVAPGKVSGRGQEVTAPLPLFPTLGAGFLPVLDA